ncbi:MAG: endonuclease/exonuclease/phosphatase family protein, partial [Bacteroidales bacterium]|nr:endonuclease/exonuclease/phosphatase family protein [Bacteroidales bacterium]
TLNLRYDNPRDSLNAWPNRAPIVTGFIEEEKPELLGLQEALYHQYEYLDSLLTDYNSIGVGRDDGGRSGEMCPVFYLKDRFDFIRTKTFWLSETPETPGSQAWGANLPRIVTWVELKDRNTGKHLYFFNTHFAHDSDSARIMSSSLLLHRVDSISAGSPFVITGDFNMTHSSKGYSILTGPYESVPLLQDTYVVSERDHTGPAYTFNGFSDKARDGRIDYVFVRNGIRVLRHRTFIIKEHGIFISDHWPVMALIELK